ncbi:21603_t:CDS:2, partial [Gigaspora rosea]
MEKIVKSLPEVILEINELLAELLLRKIFKEEIVQVIKILPDNKSSGTNSLIYKFYKGTIKTLNHIDTEESCEPRKDTELRANSEVSEKAKAFDRVNHKFLEYTLGKIKFEQRGKEGSKARGFLTLLLYIIAFEPLLRQLKDKIAKIPLNRQSFKLLKKRNVEVAWALQEENITIELEESHNWQPKGKSTY